MPEQQSKVERFPPQHQQTQPGKEHKMHPKPEAEEPGYPGSGKLRGKCALITGVDSGIGQMLHPNGGELIGS